MTMRNVVKKTPLCARLNARPLGLFEEAPVMDRPRVSCVATVLTVKVDPESTSLSRAATEADANSP